MLARGCMSKDGDLTILKAITSIGRAHWCLVRVTRESRFGYMAYSQYSHLCKRSTGIRKNISSGAKSKQLGSRQSWPWCGGLLVTTHPLICWITLFKNWWFFIYFLPIFYTVYTLIYFIYLIIRGCKKIINKRNAMYWTVAMEYVVCWLFIFHILSALNGDGI